MVKVKICGIRRVIEGEAAVAAGADFLGFVFYPPSHRNLRPEAARDLLAAIRAGSERTDWAAVGVFVNEPAEWVNEVAALCGLDYVQLHGTESPAYCARMERPVIKAVRLPELEAAQAAASDDHAAYGGASDREPAPLAARFGAARILLDAPGPGHRGGMGQRFDWARARSVAGEALVAGGLGPDNVVEALETLAPWGVDASSGLERDGFKDPALIRAFIASVRAWQRQMDGRLAPGVVGGSAVQGD